MTEVGCAQLPFTAAYVHSAPFAKPRFQRFPLLLMRLQDAMLPVASEGHDAHKMALPSCIHTGGFSCETEKHPQECMSELVWRYYNLRSRTLQ